MIINLFAIMVFLKHLNSCRQRKKLFFYLLLFSLVLFAGSSIVVFVFHNDDTRHEPHTRNHSPVCQWLHEGKLCGRTASVSGQTQAFISFLFLFAAPVAFSLRRLPVARHSEQKQPFNISLLAAKNLTRAPPAR